ncbi:hypothetical protein ACH5RR_036397 [Cinchona calisaya]|uniref:Uncharacterized protein n=1 Tax=Cinchona calisaya TaxID=153742 RepID=A0ABD2Y8J8_9GENT
MEFGFGDYLAKPDGTAVKGTCLAAPKKAVITVIEGIRAALASGEEGDISNVDANVVGSPSSTAKTIAEDNVATHSRSAMVLSHGKGITIPPNISQATPMGLNEDLTSVAIIGLSGSTNKSSTQIGTSNSIAMKSNVVVAPIGISIKQSNEYSSTPPRLHLLQMCLL